MTEDHHQIGEVADRVGLSLRTIRYYEEVGLVVPSGRTHGGFRLYTTADIDRLSLVKALKPVGMSLETMGELLRYADLLTKPDTRNREEVQQRFQEVLTQAHRRCDELEGRLSEARQALADVERLPLAVTRPSRGRG